MEHPGAKSKTGVPVVVQNDCVLVPDLVVATKKSKLWK